MQKRTVTITLNLSDEAARYFDQAAYEYDTRFTEELEDNVAEYLMQSRQYYSLNQMVIDTAENVRFAHEAFEHEQFKDMVAEYGVAAL